MDHGSQPKSRLASVAFTRELLCRNGSGSMLNITCQWLNHDILIFVIRVHYGKLGHMLKPPVAKFRSDISILLISPRHAGAPKLRWLACV